MRNAKRSSRRPARRERNVTTLESLEPRVLLSTYLFADQGSATANATSLQNIINKTATVDGTHYLLVNDVLQINPTSQFLFTTGTGNTQSLVIPNRTDFAQGSGTITIETSAQSARLPSGRISPANETQLVQFQAGRYGKHGHHHCRLCPRFHVYRHRSNASGQYD